MLNEARVIVRSYEIHTGTTMGDVADDEIVRSLSPSAVTSVRVPLGR